MSLHLVRLWKYEWVFSTISLYFFSNHLYRFIFSYLMQDNWIGCLDNSMGAWSAIALFIKLSGPHNHCSSPLPGIMFIPCITWYARRPLFCNIYMTNDKLCSPQFHIAGKLHKSDMIAISFNVHELLFGVFPGDDSSFFVGQNVFMWIFFGDLYRGWMIW